MKHMNLTAIAGETSKGLTYDPDLRLFIISHEDLEHYARIIAYKVAHNLQQVHTLNPNEDPLTYITCNDCEWLLPSDSGLVRSPLDPNTNPPED